VQEHKCTTPVNKQKTTKQRVQGVTGITIEELEKKARPLKGATIPDSSKPS